MPAYVLLRADTGGEVNLLKTVRLTTDVAVQFISELRPEDPVAVPEGIFCRLSTACVNTLRQGTALSGQQSGADCMNRV